MKKLNRILCIVLSLILSNIIQGAAVPEEVVPVTDNIVMVENTIEILSINTDVVENTSDINNDATSKLSDVKALQEFVEKVKTVEEERQRLEAERLEQMRKSNVSFNPFDVTEISGVTHEEMYELLKDTGLSDVSDAFVDAEQQEQINAFALLGIVANESSWGKSARAVGHSKNLGGVEVYSDSSVGRIYASRYDSVMDIANFLRRDYLDYDGQYYHGRNTDGINYAYSASEDWDRIVDSIAQNKVQEYHRKFN